MPPLNNRHIVNTLDPTQFGSPKVSVMRGKAAYDDTAAIRQQIEDAITALELPADFIKPGDRVVIKPNWVKEHNASKSEDENGWLTIITHPVVVRETARWAAKKLQGRGSVTLCDAPQSDSSFDTIRRLHQLDQLVTDLTQEFPGIAFLLFDMRCEEWTIDDGVTIAKRQLPSDPSGAVDIHLDADSEFIGPPAHRSASRIPHLPHTDERGRAHQRAKAQDAQKGRPHRRAEKPRRHHAAHQLAATPH